MTFMSRCSDSFRRVRDWMFLAGQPVPNKPKVPDLRTRKLRASLLLEELGEFISSCNLELSYKGEALKLQDIRVSYAGPNVIWVQDVAHELADLNFVLLGTMVAFGLPDELLMDEVCNINNLKVGHPKYPSTVNESGKVIKHPDIPKPNFDRVLKLYRLENPDADQTNHQLDGQEVL